MGCYAGVLKVVTARRSQFLFPGSRHHCHSKRNFFIGRCALVKGEDSDLKSKFAKVDTPNTLGGTSAAPNNDSGASESLTYRKKLTRTFAQYGSVAFAFHISISLISLGFFYALFASGVDITPLIAKLGLESKLVVDVTTFVAAYAVHKCLAPLRIVCTCTCTPLLVARLRKLGLYTR